MSPYWTCQLVGWSVYALMAAAIPTLYGGPRGVVVARAVVGAVLGLGLTHLLRQHIRRRGWLQLPLRRLVPRIAAASVGIAVVLMLAILPFLLRIIPLARAGPFAAVFAGHVTLLLVWSGIYLTVHYLRGLRSVEGERLRLELALRETELQALRAQLNPHFLFNSLNSLRGLVTEDPTRAREAVTGMAGLLRYALRSSRTRTIAVERELEATRHYLGLEALRFESRLRYDIEVDPEALDHPVPPMLVQTLAENAIKHGIATLPDGGIIRIEVRRRPHDLHIRVTNTGVLRPRSAAGPVTPVGGLITSGPTGIGLVNSLDRLRLTFGEGAELTLVESPPGEVRCDVIIPTPRIPDFAASEAAS